VSAFTLLVGDAGKRLQEVETGTAQMCVTSPPYFGLRDYGVKGQLGSEPTVALYVKHLVEILAEVHRALRPDGTLWLNLGDSFTGSGKGGQGKFGAMAYRSIAASRASRRHIKTKLPPKNLFGVPWRVALALQDDGWILRQDIIWHKPNPMPGSFKDRCTTAHEYVFLLSKQRKYFFDHEAIKEPAVSEKHSGNGFKRPQRLGMAAGIGAGSDEPWTDVGGLRNARSVWTIATTPSDLDHFAMFPEELARRCIVAGSRPGDLVLDPFAGMATTGIVALKEGRRFLGCELSPKYARDAEKRSKTVTPSLFRGVA
jgi:DNA modification methylase